MTLACALPRGQGGAGESGGRGRAQVSELSGAPGRHGRGRQLRGAGDRQYPARRRGGEHVARFDKGGDHFYDLISAVHKSIRGSAPDAALYWYARMVSAGCDPFTSPAACWPLPRKTWATPIPVPCRWRSRPGTASIASARRKGAGHRPGHRLPRLCPKSNAVYTAWKAALHDAKNLPDFEVPPHLRNAPTKLMSELGYGAEYRYAHDEPGPMPPASSTSPELAGKRYYQPTERGLEKQIARSSTICTSWTSRARASDRKDLQAPCPESARQRHRGGPGKTGVIVPVRAGAVCYTARLTPVVLALHHLLDFEGPIPKAKGCANRC